MRGIFHGFMALAGLLCLLPFSASAFPQPMVRIEVVDRRAYEHPGLPESGTETLATPTRRAAFLVSRSGSTHRSLTVAYAIRGGASNGVDYVALSGRVTIPAGSRSARIVVRPIDDEEVESRAVPGRTVYNETVIIALQRSVAYWLDPQREAKAVIQDDDLTPSGVIIVQPRPPQNPRRPPPPIPVPVQPGVSDNRAIEVVPRASRDRLIDSLRSHDRRRAAPPSAPRRIDSGAP